MTSEDILSGIQGNNQQHDCELREGPPGEQGPPGVCSIEQCREAALPGPPGPPGEKGDKGDPGQFDVNDERSVSFVREMVKNYLSLPEIHDLFRGPRGDPGKCVCEKPNDSPSAMVFERESDLSKTSHTLPIGTMAYVKEVDTFYLKTGDKTNTWRVISMLYLVARNERLRGDLRQGNRLTGAHAGSIYACQRSANAVGLGRAFYPLISTDVFNMDYVVPPTYRYGVPLVNVNVSRHSPCHQMPQ
ncbi:unnamed protein product [Echinostoma caproni]|uniref:Endostatin domain-containing protein n=1 Tax=Echinostoma caproni TaxID=27848 RepID=A0A183A6M2_9TREM|nr:unnamed protein product [Echinostoma caproni]